MSAAEVKQIQVGDALPEATFTYYDADNNRKNITTAEAFAGKKVALFAVPGAFTSTCSKLHCPSFVRESEEFRKRGFLVYCTAVNDADVMQAWCEIQKAQGKITFLADGNAEFATKIGLTVDLAKFGMGLRSKRYGMIVDDGKVTHIAVEQPGKYEVSSAEALLAHL